MDALTYLLHKAVEECGEFTKAAMKGLNHGVEEHNSKEGCSNINHILAEAVDILGALSLLADQVNYLIGKGELDVTGYPSLLNGANYRGSLHNDVLAKKAKIVRWAYREVRKGRLTGDLSVLKACFTIPGEDRMRFVCDNCSKVDFKALAYPNHDFHRGPPQPWLCRVCQGKELTFGELPMYNPVEHSVINRGHGLTVSME